MGTDIKPAPQPGQVWASDDNRHETATVREVRGNEVWATDDQSGSHFVRAEAGFRDDYHLVTDTAPLDPAVVKAGDTVTLESVLDEPFDVTGVVEKINVTQTDSSGKAVAFNVMIWARWFTVGLNLRLAAHQPAPEPVRPGAYVVSPKANPEARYTGIIDNYETFRGEEDGFYRGLNRGHYTVVGPLVVIDPADVSVAALIDAAIESAQGKGYWPDRVVGGHMIRHALADLGIEQ